MSNPQQKAYYESPIGWFEIVGTPLGIQSAKRIDDPQPNPDQILPILKDCILQLQEYFARERTEFDLKIDWQDATPFNQSVWVELLKIPYGRTCSYSDISNRIQNPDAVRAVGLANRNNPIAIIVPCHRVIGKNGNLTGYFYGLDVKRQLLELENPLSFAQQGTLF